MTPGPRLGLLFGADSQSGKAQPDQELHNLGSTDVRLLRSGDPMDFDRMHVPRNFFRLKTRPSFDGVGTVLNLVTDADMNPVVLDNAARFLKSFRGRIINRPEAVIACTRDHVAARLAGIDGLVVPRVARFRGRRGLALAAIDRAGISFPAILRRIGTHGGRIEGVMSDGETMLAQLDPAATYYLTEFVDYRSEDGFYHKIRIFFFGSQAVIRHELISDRWNVHAADRQRILVHQPEAISAERRLVEGGPDALPPVVRRVLAEIRVRMPLDFFGLDCTILPDGRVLLFEANATMSFLPISDDPLFSYGAFAFAQGRIAFDAMLEAA